MITEIRLQNARIYDHSEWAFPLSRLTILCGTNSAGKSTVLKCLLLLVQNMSARSAASSARAGVALRFSNPMSDLGSFKSFVSHNDVSRELHLGVSVETIMSHDNYKILDRSVDFRAQDDSSDAPAAYHRYSIDADFYFCTRQSLVYVNEWPELKTLDLKSDDDEDDASLEHRAFLRSARFRILSKEGEVLVEFTLIRRARDSGSGVDYFLRLPKVLLDKETEGFSYTYEQDSDPSFGLLRVSMSGIVPERVFRGEKIISGLAEESQPRFLSLPDYLEEAFTDLKSAMSRVVYLGPLRAAAVRYYPIQSDLGSKYDATGEQLPLLLRDRGSSVVTCASPLIHAPVKCDLTEALDTWLHFLRTGATERNPVVKRELKINSMQDAFVELGIRSSSGTETHALADSGFGYSQLLPILVRGLMLQPGATLVIEQPEVHLNPSLQVRLCDFIVAMASAGKQIVIETHSEHIVNAIRAITAEGASVGGSDECTVLYLDVADGRPQLHKLSVLSDGTVPDWPQGFFGEAAQLLGRIMRAKKARRN